MIFSTIYFDFTDNHSTNYDMPKINTEKGVKKIIILIIHYTKYTKMLRNNNLYVVLTR